MVFFYGNEWYYSCNFFVIFTFCSNSTEYCLIVYNTVPSLDLDCMSKLKKYIADLISIYSQNTRGLNCFQKRRDVFQYLRKKNYNIICLQDVHIENNMENFIKNEWGYSMYLSGLSSNKRGVMVLINNNFDQEVTKVVKDPNGLDQCVNQVI